MWASAIALAILMWLWTGISARLMCRPGSGVNGALKAVWLFLALTGGAAGLLAITWWVLPESYVSRGWTRLDLERAQQLAALLVLAVGALGFVSGKRRLVPAARQDVASADGRKRPGAKHR